MAYEESNENTVSTYFGGVSITAIIPKYNNQDVVFRGGSHVTLQTPDSIVANGIGLTADKIMEGNTILGIEGTGKGTDDLTTQLTAQDNVIAQQQTKIDELTKIIDKKSATNAKVNVFMQEEAPAIPEGIWLKGTYQVDNIISDENVFTSEEWDTVKMGSLSAIPYDFQNGGVVSHGTDIYLFGSGNYSSMAFAQRAYKYDTLTDTYTKLTNIPYNFWGGGTVIIDNYIYLFGSKVNTGSQYTYKYDILTDTYTRLADIPYKFSGKVTVVGTNIYLFGTNNTTGNISQYTYKYDTLTDTYTKLTNIPYSCYYPSVITVGTDIYLCGADSSHSYMHKYDTLTNTYIMLKTPPYHFYYGFLIGVDNYIYLLGGNSSDNNRNTYKYDTLTNTYTKLTNIPYSFSEGGATIANGYGYLFGGSSNRTKVQTMKLIPKEYPINSIVISQSTAREQTTNLCNVGITNLKTYYDRVYYEDSEGNLLNNIVTYNGNGTEWVQIN